MIYRDDLTTPCFDYRPVYYFSAHFDDNNPFVPSAITYPILSGVDDPSVTEKLQYDYWDSEIYIHYNEDGMSINEYDSDKELIKKAKVIADKIFLWAMKDAEPKVAGWKIWSAWKAVDLFGRWSIIPNESNI